jgi:hypothetical protein
MTISFEHLIEFWEVTTKRILNEKRYCHMSYSETGHE